MIGTTARYIAVQDAPKHIAGYCVVNDVSEREFQIERGGQWTKGKSADTFCPMGPWLVTADEVPNPGKLQLWTEVNGERRQDSNTADLIFGIDHIVSYVSQFMTLDAGRRDPDRHAVRGRAGLQAAEIPQARRRDAAVGRGPRRAEAAPRRVPGRAEFSAVSARLFAASGDGPQAISWVKEASPLGEGAREQCISALAQCDSFTL